MLNFVQGALRCKTSVMVVVAMLLAGGPATDARADGVTGLWVTPQEIDFGPVGVGSTSSQVAITITNYSPLLLDGFAGGGVGAPFSATQDCAAGVSPGGQCHYYFRFSPTAEGEFSAVSSSGTSLGPIKINLHGTGVGAKVVYDAHSLDMGSVYVGNSATQQEVTLRNVGLATLTNFAGGGVNAPFSATQNCAGGVAPGGSCKYFFGFSPDTAGAYTATSSSSTNGGSVVVALKGTGRSIVFGSGQRVSPLSLDFGPVGVDTTSAQLKTQIHNQSIFSEITGWAGGGVSAPFTATQDCASGVPANGNCYFYYTFSPKSAGEFTTTSNVSNSFGSFSIELHGTGVAPTQSVTPLWLDFGPVALNTTSPVQTVTIKNTGLSTITGWAGGGVGAPFSATQDCAAGVAPGASCHFNYYFKPTASGFFTGKSNVSTAAGSFSILLQGGAHPAEYALGVTFPGTGSGTVTSSPSGINCNTDCTASFMAGTPVTLSPAAGEFSIFTGWANGCAGSGNCSITANADKSVSAVFDLDTSHRARIGANYYSTLTLAYSGASSVGNVTIEAAGTDFNESLYLSGEKEITLKGGYLGNFSSNSDGYTSMNGVLTVGKGSLTVERLVITSI